MPPSFKKGLSASLFVLTASLLSGCQDRFGLPQPATEQGHDVMHLWHFCLYTAFAIGVVVFGFLLYSIVRHRRRNDELPRQTEGHVGLEITWTVIPLIIVAVLFGYGLKAQAATTALKRNPPLVINVTGYQWNWRFDYPTENNITVAGGPQSIQDESTFPELVLPVNERVRLNLVAADVNHSFFVPNFLTKRDLIPGIKNEIEVTPDRINTYVGHCAEFCGLNHSQMNFRVKVVSQSDFQAWVQQQKQAQEATNS
jgi:cytochrome c oxidase subunit II